jgi:uncharacterized protein
LNKYSPEEKFILQFLAEKLPDNLTYHGLHHTLDVLNAAMKIAKSENLSSCDIRLLRIAILYHDAGFTAKYKDHEDKGCEMVRNNLPAAGYSSGEIDTICGMIAATKIPQDPHNILEQVICDADLDYLGRSDFYKIGDTLFQEMKMYSNLQDEKEWNRIQEKFLGNHRYHTSFGKRNREHRKQRHLAQINKIVATY